MKYLVDANVLSEATRLEPAPKVIAWLDRHDADLLVNPIVLGEFEYGILLLPAGKRRKSLLDWFQGGIKQLNVIEIDAETGSIWARLLADLRRKGKTMPIKDSLVAASARQHGLTVATRNTSDFRHAGIRVVNPFKSS